MKMITIILGVLVAIGGIYCLFAPGATFLSLGWLVGIALIVAGINAIAAHGKGKKTGHSTVWDVVGGVLTILAGFFVTFNLFTRLLTDVALIYIFAAWLVLTGILRIVSAFKLKGLKLPWVWFLIAGILGLLLGLYSFFHPVITAFSIGYLLGFWVLFAGINLIATGMTMKKDKAA